MSTSTATLVSRELAVKRRALDSRRHTSARAGAFKKLDYPHRLNFYATPPTAEITLDQFEQWAIDRLRILGEIESCQYRNKNPSEVSAAITPLLAKYLPLSANSSNSEKLPEERRKDHYSHFILRLAFARSDDLRRRFSRAESTLFRHRFTTDDARERQAFVASLGLDWEAVSEEEKRELADQLMAASGSRRSDEERYFKVDWERVPDLVEQKKVLLKRGKAYVPAHMQVSLVMAEFTARLDKALELTARALPRLDEDDRLIPILNHLSLGFTAPEYNNASAPTLLTGAPLTAASIDNLSQHFPACMKHLHLSLRRNKHLKHFGRLQYTLFLKGIGLSVEESLTFWRSSFSNTPEDKFNKEYRYNVRHAYGLEGNRRNYKPHSCQQILTEHPPGPGEAHGCPYRHFSVDNLAGMLQTHMGVNDRDVLRGVRADVEAKKFHLACNRVFEYAHAAEIRREKEKGAGIGDTIIHPNEYFVRSWELKHPEAAGAVGGNAGTRRGGQAAQPGDSDSIMM